jgi:hypothetical protein
MSTHWEDLDVEALLNRRDEQMTSGGAGGGTPGATTSANAGSFAVPLGTPLRRKFPTGTPGYSKVAHPYLPDTESNDSGDLDYEWAKRQVK